MEFKPKIITVVMCGLIAGFGLFGGNINVAQAQSGNANGLSIAQMQLIINSLNQQIQQLQQLTAQLKPLEICGNGFCRFGETAAGCPGDCGTGITCIKEGQNVYSAGQCCPGLIVITDFANHSYKCVKTGVDTLHTCSIDVDCVSACDDCVNRNTDAMNYACSYGPTILSAGSCECAKGLCETVTAVCGNGKCETGETPTSCLSDCKQSAYSLD